MKTLLTIFTLIFTVMFSSSSFAGWTKVGKNVKGSIYVDFERIRKVDSYVFYWQLGDFLEPAEGFLSVTIYRKLVKTLLDQFWVDSCLFMKKPTQRWRC